MAIYVDSLPYLVTTQKTVSLPKGDPVNYGSLAFLLSPSVQASMKMMHDVNVKPDNYYDYYYYNLTYTGTIYSRHFNIRDLDGRKSAYNLVKTVPGVNAHNLGSLETTPNRNTYYDLSRYLDIFFKMTDKMPPVKRMESFWTYFKSIISSNQTKDFPIKNIIINAQNYSNMGGSLKEQMMNPIFIFYYTLYRNFNLIKDLDLDFIFYCERYVLRVNPSKCDKTAYTVFKREIGRLMGHVKTDLTTVLDETKISNEIQKEEIKSSLEETYHFTGTNDADVTDMEQLDKEVTTTAPTVDPEISGTIKDKVDIAVDAIDNLTDDDATAKKEVVKTRAEMEISGDKELISKMYNYNMKQKVGKNQFSTARDEELRQKQREIMIGDMTLEQLQKIKTSNVTIPTRNVGSKMKTTNKNMAEVKFTHFEKAYNENVMKKDMMNIFTSLNNKSIPMYIRDVHIEETSDPLNYKETYTVQLEDANRQRHTIKVDIPKMLEDKFMWVGGNKKLIIKQLFMLPVIKTAPDTVQIVTNYNKMFIRRIGTRSLGSIQRMKKLVEISDEFRGYIKPGNLSTINEQYITTIEYDELARSMGKFVCGDTTINFNQKEVTTELEEKGIKIPEKKICIGYKGKKPIFLDINTQVDENGDSICTIMYNALPEDLQGVFNTIKTGKRLMYNSVTIMTQSIPLASLLCYWEGIIAVLKKANINYRFSDKSPQLSPSESFIKFADTYLIYEDDVPTSLLMNGLKLMDTQSYSLEEMDTKEPYNEFFKRIYGKLNTVNALANAYEFTLDDITIEVLQDLALPTELVELCIYANNLLADNEYKKESSMTIYRIRSNEIIPAILHSEIARHYINFRNSAGKRKLSIPRDCVIKQLMALQTVEDYSTLNPHVELEKTRTVTAKGWRGANVDRAYTEEKRSYDPTMVGILAMSTPTDGNVGVTKFLTMEPNIKSTRGYVDIKDDKLDELKDVNLYSPVELLTTLGSSHDDSIRSAMAGKQSKHVIPIRKASPVLISNGAEQAVRFNLSSDFIVNAKDDGEVVEKDEKLQLMVLKYKDGSTQAVDLSPHIVKNGGGGFYLSNQLVTKLELGDKFKKDDLIARHKDFFSDDQINGLRMNVGAFEKVAVMSSYNTYQDSCFITKKLSEDTATEMVFNMQAVIGKNSNVDFVVNVGDHINVDDTLIQFDTSFDDSELNKFLKSLSADLKEEINQTSKNNIKSKYSGIIEDIKVYSTIDLDDMSPSLKELVSKFYRKINEKKKLLNQYDDSNSIVKCGLLFNETTGKVEPNKFGVIKGAKVEDSVLIEFYIKHTDVMGVGDKIAYFTALKSICGEIIPEGFEPYSEFRPEEEVSSTISQSAILKRMTPSIITTILGNKVLVELKRSLQDIYNE